MGGVGGEGRAPADALGGVGVAPGGKDPSRPPDRGDRGLARVERSARSQSILISTARTFAALLTMAIPIVLVRILDQTTFGHYKQLFLVANTALPLLSLGLPGSLYYFVPRSPAESQRFHVQTTLMLSLLGLLGGMAIALARGPLGELFNAPLESYLAWIALFAGLSVPASLAVISPMVDRRARLAATLLSGFDVVRSGSIIAVAVITGDLTAILMAACAAMALQVIAVLAYLAWRSEGEPWRPSAALLRTQLAYALPLTGTALIGLAQKKIHAYYVAANFSAAQFAIYAVATLNIPLIGQLSRTVGEVVVIENTEHHANRDLASMRRVWYRATHVLGLLLLPVFLLGEFFAEDVVRLLFGASYLEATPMLRVYLAMMPLSIFLGSPMLRATADLRVMLLADLAALGVTVASLIPLVARFGPIGAVASLVLGKATFMAVASRRTAHRLELGLRDFMPWAPLAGMVALGAATAWAAHEAVVRIGLPLAPRILVGAAVAASAYAAVAWVTGLLPEQEKQLVRARLRALRSGAGGTR